MQDLDAKPRGIDLRRTKHGTPKWMTYSFDQCADGVFRHAGRIIQELDGKDFDTRLKATIALLPISLKRIPDKSEVLQLTLSASAEDMAALMNLAQANIAQRAMIHGSHTVKPIIAVTTDGETS